MKCVTSARFLHVKMQLSQLAHRLITALLLMTTHNDTMQNKYRNRHPLHKLNFIANILYPRKKLNITTEYAVLDDPANTPATTSNPVGIFNMSRTEPPVPPPRPNTKLRTKTGTEYVEVIGGPPTPPPSRSTSFQNLSFTVGSSTKLPRSRSMPSHRKQPRTRPRAPDVARATAALEDLDITGHEKFNDTAMLHMTTPLVASKNVTARRPKQRKTAPAMAETTAAMDELRVTRPELFTKMTNSSEEPNYGNVSSSLLHNLGVPPPRPTVPVPLPRTADNGRPDTPIPRNRASRSASLLNDKFQWLKAAQDYQTCGQYTPPDTCRYAGADDYRCTMPVGTTTALIIRTMRLYGIPFRMYLIDRGTFGLHLDVMIRARNMPQLVGLFTMEDIRLIANNLEEEEKAIYEAFRSEIGVLPDPNPQYDRQRQLGRIVQ